MNKYPTYKPSNIPWLGDVPEHWEEQRLNGTFSVNKNANSTLNEKNALQFRFGEIISKPRFEESPSWLETIMKYNIVSPNDIVINGLNLNYDFLTQRVAIVKTKGVITSAYISITPREFVNPNYYCYFLKTMDAKKIINGLGSGIRLTLDYSELKKQFLPLPPLPEQTQIVRYLDWKTGQINKLISTKKKQIALLKEQKQRVINEAVTKGGESWKVRRLKQVVTDCNDKSSPKGKFYIGMENIVSWNATYISTDSIVDGDSKMFKKGYILFGKLRPYLAKVFLTENEGVCSSEFLVLREFAGYLPFLKYFLLSYDFIMLVNASTYGAKMPRANWDFIGNCKIAIPPLSEQRAIVTYLNKATAKIDLAIANAEREIALFNEYRTRLISDVVTGKVDVRGVVVPEFEPVEEIIEDGTEENTNND